MQENIMKKVEKGDFQNLSSRGRKTQGCLAKI